MELIGLDKKTYKVIATNYNKTVGEKSKLHKKTEEILKELIPTISILQEFPIAGSSDKMYLDFLIPSLRLAIEVQGEQHYKFNSFFFKNKKEFKKQQNRDELKKEWCQINNYKYLALSYKEEELWKNQIIQQIS